MKILILIITQTLKNAGRYLFWLYKLQKANIGKKFIVKFPVKVEGKGKLIFGNNNKVGKNSYFACGYGSTIKFGNNCRIDDNVEIYAGKNAIITFGDNCWIMKNTIIRTKNEFIFDNNVSIATNCSIFSREEKHEGILTIKTGTAIGDNTIIDVADNVYIYEEVAIGPNCVIYTHDHDYTNKKKAAWKGGVVKAPVIVNKGAWVASSVTILPNVEIGERTVIAAGAVVTKSTESNSIYGGVPAKKIKTIE